MAKITLKRPQNISGEFYVDRSCIDCDTCRWMAPDTFSRAEDQSAVHHQPQTPDARLRALQALLSCPTSSIGTEHPPQDIRTAQQSFPLAIADNVYHCGYHSEKSYAAASYFIQRPEGNILIDSPRFNPPLVKKLEAMGGIRYLYLTHRDDVADHQAFRDHFGCDRLLHQDDLSADTTAVEQVLQGQDPIQFAPDILIVPVPGHTQGHTVLLVGDRFLFTGDHLAWSDELQTLIAFRRHCWYSWTEQTASMKTLLNYSFEWVLPGHGRRHHAPADIMHQHLEKCVAWMETH
jgi:glyoxylase-like metal-dependent hydrolase (beta-lactamase superfamily II)/ferredoxin